MEHVRPDRPTLPPSNQASQPSTPVIDSERLFAGHREIRIQHQGTDYRLRITRNGKLILNK